MKLKEDSSDIPSKTEKQELILQAAMEIFSKNGFHEALVDDIANLAGVGKGTVYRNFPSKQELFLALIEWGLNSLKEEITTKTDKIENLFEKMDVAIDAYLSFFEQKRNFYRVLIQERSLFREKVGIKFKEKYFAHLYLLEDYFKKGMKARLFKKMDPQSASIALIGLINSLIYKWLISEKEYSLHKEKKVIMNTFFKGILVDDKK